MIEKRSETSQPIADVVSKRWSCRSFNADKIISREQIISLCEAARWAPSCFGDEPWNFIICDKNSNPESWNNAYECLGEWNQNWAKNAPVLIVSLANKTFRKNGKENYWAKYDTGAACENLCLQAVELGIMAHQMGGYDAEKVNDIFKIPDNIEIMTVIAVGYQDSSDKLSDEYRQLELKARERRPLSENFFDGELGKRIK